MTNEPSTCVPSFDFPGLPFLAQVAQSGDMLKPMSHSRHAYFLT